MWHCAKTAVTSSSCCGGGLTPRNKVCSGSRVRSAGSRVTYPGRQQAQLLSELWRTFSMIPGGSRVQCTYGEAHEPVTVDLSAGRVRAGHGSSACTCCVTTIYRERVASILSTFINTSMMFDERTRRTTLHCGISQCTSRRTPFTEQTQTVLQCTARCRGHRGQHDCQNVSGCSYASRSTQTSFRHSVPV
jgi:hypothetical protein